MTNEIKELQKRVSKICKELNLNSIALSKMIEFDDIELVDNVLQGKSVPTLTMLNKIVTHLGINPAWLYDMPYPIAYTKFGTDNSKIFSDKPLTKMLPRGEENLLNYCKRAEIKNVMLVFDDFDETNDDPRVAVIIEKDFVYEIISVFDFFNTDNSETKDGLLDIDSIIDTTTKMPINVMVNTLPVVRFNDMLCGWYHIGVYVAKNQLTDDKANRVVDLAFEYREDIVPQLEKSFGFKSEFLEKIDFVRSFVKSTRI